MGWNEKKNITVEQRSKEEANDYRYFPEPDLPILHFTKEYLDELRAQLPELPAAKRERFKQEYGLADSDIENLINWKELTFFFEELVSEIRALHEDDDKIAKLDLNKLIRKAANFALQDFAALLNAAKIDLEESKITPQPSAELLCIVEKGEISGTAAKQVLKVMFEKGADPHEVIEELGLHQVSDESAIITTIEKVIGENGKAVADFKAGQEKSFGFLVGQVMREMKGKGNPAVINDLLRKKLNE